MGFLIFWKCGWTVGLGSLRPTLNPSSVNRWRIIGLRIELAEIHDGERGQRGVGKGQVHEVISEEIKHKRQEPCPRGVTQDVLIAPGMSCENTCEMLCTCEARQGLSAQGFSWGLVILVPSAW